jgi:hypothetical protein
MPPIDAVFENSIEIETSALAALGERGTIDPIVDEFDSHGNSANRCQAASLQYYCP